MPWKLSFKNIQWNLCILDTLGSTDSVLITEVSRSVYIIKDHLGPQLSVWIIKVSSFSSVLINRFHCITTCNSPNVPVTYKLCHCCSCAYNIVTHILWPCVKECCIVCVAIIGAERWCDFLLLHRYDALFGFLINIRQVQVTLQRCWALQMMHKGSEDRLTPAWQLRSHMGFFVDNIQYYVQVDVIESQFSLLLENIRSTHDFETIQQAHCNFISSLFRQLFLQMPSVSSCEGTDTLT